MSPGPPQGRLLVSMPCKTALYGIRMQLTTEAEDVYAETACVQPAQAHIVLAVLSA